MRFIPCPLCAAEPFTVVVTTTRKGHPYQCVRCDACRFHYVNPEPSAAELFVFYGSEYQAVHEQIWHGNEDEHNATILRIVKDAGVRSLVDLGAGQGRFVASARDAGIDARGVEPIAGNVEEAQRRYGLTLSQATVAEYLATGPTDIECFTMLNVFEHLPGPLTVARNLHDALRPGGTLVVIVPNLSFTLTLGLLRRAAGFRDVYMLESPRFGQQGFQPPVHLSSFDAPRLRALLTRAGFVVTRMRQAPVVHTPNAIMNVAKRGVYATGRMLELFTGGAVHWGYSLLAVAKRS